MKLIRAAAVVLNQTPLDWDGNLARVVAAVEAAREQGSSLVCLPELCLTGYACEDAFFSPFVWKTSQELLAEFLPKTKGIVASIGLPIHHRNALFNAACLCVDGKVLGLVAKRFLAGDGIHYEPRWFKPWPAGACEEAELLGKRAPLGDMMFDVGGVRIGFEICEDAWVADRPGAQLARRGVDVILNPSASHFAFDKFDIRQRFVLEGSRAFGCTYVYANLMGNEAGRAIYDGGALIASSGTLLAAGPRLSFADWGVTSAVIDVDATRASQARIASYRPTLGETNFRLERADFSFPATPLDLSGPSAPAAWELSHRRKEEEFSRAVSLALFDYLRKSKSNGFVISLSGGADSTACAVLVRLLAEWGVAELGWEGFTAKLPHWAPAAKARSFEELMPALLTCVYQASANSGAVTRNAARTVADDIGALFWEFQIEAVCDLYRKMVEHSVGRPLTWKTDDVTLQNIQARVRSPSVWMVANMNNALLLSTSNRSEAAVGYATMDGDTSGGLSPIAGIDKAFLREWLRWMQEHGPADLGPRPALACVTQQAPTAELRPQEAKQTDEDDLMPYPLLDAVERAAIRDKLSPVETFARMERKFPQYSPAQLGLWVDRFFKLWCRNQWKRERYAPSFHLDDENLDPKTWCRFPILSGGFARELAQLAEVVKAKTGK